MSSLPGTTVATGTSADDAPAAAPPPTVQGDGVIHEIQWSDALPWWLLFRAAGVAFSPTVILLAACGSLATWAGWSVADRIGVPDGTGIGTFLEAFEAARGTTDMAEGAAGPGSLLRGWLPAPAAAILRLVSVPFNPAATLGQCAGALARLAWFVAVWSIFGTGVSRQGALKLAAEETPGLAGSLLFG